MRYKVFMAIRYIPWSAAVLSKWSPWKPGVLQIMLGVMESAPKSWVFCKFS